MDTAKANIGLQVCMHALLLTCSFRMFVLMLNSGHRKFHLNIFFNGHIRYKFTFCAPNAFTQTDYLLKVALHCTTIGNLQKTTGRADYDGGTNGSQQSTSCSLSIISSSFITVDLYLCTDLELGCIQCRSLCLPPTMYWLRLQCSAGLNT